MPLEEQREGAEATEDVLRRVGAVDAQDEALRPLPAESRPPLQTTGSTASASSSPGSTEIGRAMVCVTWPA